MTELPRREDFPHFETVQTRWMDNDLYGHVNNVVYYSYFDSVINRYLIEVGGLDIHGAEVIGVCAESSCRYLAPFAYPQPIEAGLAVPKLGRRAVTYEVGLFAVGAAELSAVGRFVHVFVERRSMKAVEIPDGIRRGLERLER